MEFLKTEFPGLFVIKPRVFKDHRGFFLESYSQRNFQKNGIDISFIQDNHSLSVEKGVLRGLHYQMPPFTQTKLIRVTHGAIYDVVVDLRKDSPMFGKWKGFELTETNFLMLLVPQGFAHGFCTCESNTEVHYKVDNFYSPEHDHGIRWDDPQLSIDWPVKEPVLSQKDSKLPLFSKINFPF